MLDDVCTLYKRRLPLLQGLSHVLTGLLRIEFYEHIQSRSEHIWLNIFSFCHWRQMQQALAGQMPGLQDTDWQGIAAALSPQHVQQAAGALSLAIDASELTYFLFLV